MNNFADRLIESIGEKNSCLAVGIDPRLDLIPRPVHMARSDTRESPLIADVATVRRFCVELMVSIAPFVVAVKPQIAFFERFGWRGYRTYWEVVNRAKRLGLIVIGDVKRGDISSTAEAYADGHLGTMGADDGPSHGLSVDAVTLSPYLGHDSVGPFTERCKTEGKGVFILVRTSNPSASDFQDVASGDRKVYEIVANKVKEWGADVVGSCGYSSVGAVVGATYPAEARRLRELMPGVFFLMPGVGAQGGEVEHLKGCFEGDGLGVLVAASRSIDYAYLGDGWSEETWREAAAAAAKDMNERINAVRLQK